MSAWWLSEAMQIFFLRINMGKGKQRAKRPCLVSSCAGFSTNGGYCEHHQDKIRKQDKARGNSHQRGYDHKWRKERDKYLQDHPLCVEHLKRNMLMPATVVDHIIAHKGDKELFWDKSNWQALCESCHNRKTASEDKGAWSPSLAQVRRNTANEESVNIFSIGDQVICNNPVMQSRLDCDDTQVWEVLDIINTSKDKPNIIEVTDGDRIKQVHHSHFKKI